MGTPETRQHPDNCGVCTGYEVPPEYVELAQSHYSMHGNGLVYNLLAAVLPVALAEVTAERDQFRDSALMYSAMVADRNAERDRLLGSLRQLYVAARPTDQGDDLDDLFRDGETDVEFMVAFLARRLEVLQQDGDGR